MAHGDVFNNFSKYQSSLKSLLRFFHFFCPLRNMVNYNSSTQDISGKSLFLPAGNNPGHQAWLNTIGYSIIDMFSDHWTSQTRYGQACCPICNRMFHMKPFDFCYLLHWPYLVRVPGYHADRKAYWNLINLNY